MIMIVQEVYFWKIIFLIRRGEIKHTQVSQCFLFIFIKF